jgi:hypothetical protein
MAGCVLPVLCRRTRPAARNGGPTRKCVALQQWQHCRTAAGHRRVAPSPCGRGVCVQAALPGGVLPWVASSGSARLNFRLRSRRCAFITSSPPCPSPSSLTPLAHAKPTAQAAQASEQCLPRAPAPDRPPAAAQPTTSPPATSQPPATFACRPQAPNRTSSRHNNCGICIRPKVTPSESNLPPNCKNFAVRGYLAVPTTTPTAKALS